MDVIEFIQNYKIARASTLIELFYKNPIVGRRRLTELVRLKELKRERPNNTSEFYYFIKKPKQIIHSILVTDFYAFLNKYSKIEKFKIEVDCGSIRPDAVFIYEKDGRRLPGFLEVEISNKGFDYAKYERYIRAREYEQKFHIIPTIWTVKKIIGFKDNIINELCGYRDKYYITNLAL